LLWEETNWFGKEKRKIPLLFCDLWSFEILRRWGARIDWG
jgi:hypothetical protein